MAEVGEATGKETQAGRQVYETPDGEMVSEKSTTFKYKGKWINVPTIHNGYAYDDDVLRMMLDAEVIKPTSSHKNKKDAIKSAVERSRSLGFDEGGLAAQTEEALKTKSNRLEAQRDERKLGVGLTSLEFESDMMPLLKKDPIAMLGYKASMPSRRSPSIQKLPGNKARLYYDVSEDPIGPNYNSRQDKVGYGRDYGSSKDVILHELRHRGLKILEERYKEKDSFIANYGDMAHRLLDKADISGSKSNEFVVELYDNPDATYIKPGDKGSKNTIGYISDTLQSVDPESDTQAMPDVADELLGIALTSEDHSDYRSLVNRNSLSKEEIETGKTGLNKAATDLLNEINVLGFDEGGLATQTEEALGWTAEGKKFADANPVEVEAEQEPTALSIADVPFFNRPMDASENDKWTGVQDELGNREYRTIFGRKYFVRPAEDQRTNYEKIQQDIIPAVQNYLDNPTAPSKEQTIDFLKQSLGAAWETFKIPGDLAAGNKGMEDVTLGNIFELAGGTGAASTVGKVPGGDSSNTMRIFGGPGAKDYYNRALEKAAKMKSEGASAAEIEEMTGRVATAAPGSEISAGFPNQYKFEIPDAEIKIENPLINYAKNSGLTVKESLEEITDKPGEGFGLESFIPSHFELFNQYPDLKKVTVGFTDKEGYSGFYDPSNDSVNISTELFEKGVNSPEFRSTFFHEVQHAAQARDAVKTGMNFISNNPAENTKILKKSVTDSYAKRAFETHLEKDKNLLKTRSELLALGKEILKNPNSKKLSEKLAYKYQQLQDEVYLNYLRYGKEVEARIAGARATGTKGRSIVEEKSAQLPDRVELGYLIKKPPNFLNRLSKKLGMRPIKMTPEYLQKNIDEAMDFITSYETAENYSMAEAMMKSLDNPELNFKPSQTRRYRDDIDPEVYDAFDELAEIQRGAPEIAMTSAQRALEGGVLSYALEHTGDLTHRMAEKGGVYGTEYVKPKVNRLLDSLTSGYGFEKEHLENLKNTAQFNYDKLGKNTNLSFEQFYQEYVDKVQEKIKAYAEEHKKVPVYNDMQLAGREAAIALGEGRYIDAVENLYLIKMAIDDGSYSKKSIEFNPEIDFRKNSDAGFAQGGVVNDMDRQMNLFAAGGLTDDGMSRDPVSGNDIPAGSLAEEVRDDIPAQLSEGEYVVPADVVRFFGVKYFEDLRTEAKMGLSNMEANGRIGGEPVSEPMQQPAMDNEITDQDLAQLEQMLATGVANGGLMDKMAFAAKNDRVINQRMNQGGFVVGYAAGGTVTEPSASYADPTRVDQVISRVMQAIQQKPELIQELSKRGIQVSRTNPTMQAQQMNQANPPSETAKAFADGGFNADYTSSAPGLPDWYAVPGSSYTYQGPGVPDATGQIPGAPAPVATTDASANNAADACRAMGMGYDPTTGTCILVDRGDDGGVTAPEPAEFKWEEPDVDYFKMSKEELAAIGTGAKIDPFMNKLALGASVVAGPLGLLFAGYNVYQQGKAVSEVRSAALVAKARGFDDLAETLNKQADDLVGKSSFLTQGADKFGGLSGVNDFAQQFKFFAPKGTEIDQSKLGLTDRQQITILDAASPPGMKYDPNLKSTVKDPTTGQETVVTGGYTNDNDDGPPGGSGTFVETSSGGTPIYTPTSTTVRPVSRPNTGGSGTGGSDTTTAVKSGPTAGYDSKKDTDVGTGTGYGVGTYNPTTGSGGFAQGGLMKRRKKK